MEGRVAYGCRYRGAVVDREPEAGGSDPGPDRLPRGRHGLPRELVASNQRRRLLAAVIEAVAEGGYNATTIAQITSAAGLSRRTFYEHFDNKEGCFAAAHELVFTELCETIAAAADDGAQWPLQVRASLAALLDLLAARPELASFFLIDSLRAGDRIAGRHHEAMQELIGLLLAPVPTPAGSSAERSATLEQTLAGGLSGLIVRKINASEAPTLPELLPALTELLLRPYLGDEQAMRVASGKGPER